MDQLGRKFAETDVADFPHSHDVGERLHRFLERRVRIVPMALVQIDVVRLQPAQRKVDLFMHLLGRQSFAGSVAGWKPELRAENVGVARALRQHFPEKTHRPRHVRGVDEVDAARESSVRVGASEMAPPYVFQLPRLTAEMYRSLEPSRR